MKTVCLLLFTLSILGINAQQMSLHSSAVKSPKDKLVSRHASWHSAIVIDTVGDTTWVKIKEMPLNCKNQWFKNEQITVADDKGQETKIASNEFDAFIVWGDSGIEKYIPVPVDNFSGYEKIYRVYIEGAWNLLAYNDDMTNTMVNGKPIFDQKYADGVNQSPIREKFLLYSKEQKAQLNFSAIYADNPNFGKQPCMSLLAKCPQLLKNVNKSSLYYDDMVAIGTDFNKCLGVNQVTYPKYNVYPE